MKFVKKYFVSEHILNLNTIKFGKTKKFANITIEC